MKEFLKKQYFAIAILASAGISFAFPSCFTTWFGVKLTALVVPAIQVIMFGMGTTLSLADFVRVAKCPWAVATGIFLQFLVMPIVGLLLARVFGFTGELAAGCVLVGCVAGGTASNVIAYLARANVALSVTMTCCSTLLSPFVTPFLMKLLAGCFVEIDAMKMMVEILKVVLVPVAAGGLVHGLFRRQFDAHKAVCDRVLSIVSMSGICYTLLALTAPSRDTFAAAGVFIVLAAIIHNSVGYVCGYWLTRLLGRILPLTEQDARTVAIEVGLQNGGMAGALSIGVLHSTVAALPANVFSIWMNFSGSILANRWSRRPILLFLAIGISPFLGASEKPWFVVNEDNDHFFKCDASLMTEKGLTDYADYILRGKVTHIFFCVNGQRTSYDSNTWEPIWAGLDETARPDTATAIDGTHDRWAVNAKKLFDAGIDPYVVWIRRCREKGVSPWISMRMNDVHGCTDPHCFRNTTFYKTHPEYRLDPSGTNACWFLNQLDYARPEVRDYTLAQVREIAVRWPADGVELDWMRFGHVFRLGEERQNAPLLDAFMREAAAAIRAAGRRIAVRVPYDPDVCKEYGFNVIGWAKAGLVDVVIPAPFIQSASDLPVSTWREALDGLPTRLVPDLGCETDSSRPEVPTVYRGVAASFFARGAQGVYLFNLPYKSNARYSSDSCGKAYCPDLDVAAELYENGILPDDLPRLDIDVSVMVHDWPYREMRNEARWDAFFAGERSRYRALQREIDDAAASGGGRVVVRGTLACDGPLRLRSNVELHLAEGAKLVFTDNPDRYLPAVPSSWEGIECLNRSPLVYAYGETNVAVTGFGTIAPRIERWKDWFGCTELPARRAAIRRLAEWGANEVPVANRDLSKAPGFCARPQLLQFNRCADVRLEGFRIRQSPFWCVHLFLCRNVRVNGLDIFAMGYNNDGVDVEMSKDVLIENCRLQQGDDAFAVKAGRNQDGWRLGVPSENVEIRNCRVYRGNSILAIGSEMSAGVRNVWMHDCVFDGFAGCILGIKSNERRGGFVRDVCVENIEASGVLLEAVARCWHDYPEHDAPAATVCRPARVENVVLCNIRSSKAGRRVSIRGDRREPVRKVTVENVTVEKVKGGDIVENVVGYDDK